MADLYHWWGQDLQSSASGDVRTVTGSVRGQQRLLRRLLTNPGAYIWHPEYGAGLPAYIGENLDIPAIEGVIRVQMFLENCVARAPLPIITIKPIASGVFVDIQYVDADTGEPIRLAFDVNPPG